MEQINFSDDEKFRKQLIRKQWEEEQRKRAEHEKRKQKFIEAFEKKRAEQKKKELQNKKDEDLGTTGDEKRPISERMNTNFHEEKILKKEEKEEYRMITKKRSSRSRSRSQCRSHSRSSRRRNRKHSYSPRSPATRPRSRIRCRSRSRSSRGRRQTHSPGSHMVHRSRSHHRSHSRTYKYKSTDRSHGGSRYRSCDLHQRKSRGSSISRSRSFSMKEDLSYPDYHILNRRISDDKNFSSDSRSRKYGMIEDRNFQAGTFNIPFGTQLPYFPMPPPMHPNFMPRPMMRPPCMIPLDPHLHYMNGIRQPFGRPFNISREPFPRFLRFS